MDRLERERARIAKVEVSLNEASRAGLFAGLSRDAELKWRKYLGVALNAVEGEGKVIPQEGRAPLYHITIPRVELGSRVEDMLVFNIAESRIDFRDGSSGSVLRVPNVAKVYLDLGRANDFIVQGGSSSRDVMLAIGNRTEFYSTPKPARR